MKISPLDKIYSEVIRKRALQRVGGCERCLSQKTSWKELQCSHFHGRAKRSVRYDTDNAIGICAGCHLYLTAHPLEHVEFFRKHLGEEAFDMLHKRSQILRPRPDQELITLYLQAQLGVMEER